MATALGHGRGLPFDRRVAIAAVIGLLLINVLSLAGLSLPLSIWGEYLGLAVLLGLTAFAAAAPREGVLAAIVLIPVGFPGNVPHAFTTSPSDYLIAGALVTLFIRYLRSPRWDTATLVAMAIPLLVAGPTVMALAVNLPSMSHEQLKYGVAELAGIGLASALPLALVLALRTSEGLEAVLEAATIALAIAILFGLFGVLENVTCQTVDGGGLFSGTSGRPGGLSGDPNLFSAQIAVLAGPSVLWCLRLQRWPTATLFIGAILVATVLAFTGSRGAWAPFAVFAGIWMLYALRQRRMRMAAFACLAIAALTPTIWTKLPCPFVSDIGYSVRFSERNDELAYFERLGIEMAVGSTELRLREEFDAARTALDSNPIEREPWVQPPRTVVEIADALHGVAALVPLDVARQHLWDLTIDIWQRWPVFGTGPSRLQYLLPEGWRSHNTYLTAIAENGIFGLLGLLASLAATLMLVVQSRKIFQSYAAAAVFLVLAAVLGALIAGSQDIVRQPVLWIGPGLLLVLHLVATGRASIIDGTPDQAAGERRGGEGADDIARPRADPRLPAGPRKEG